MHAEELVQIQEELTKLQKRIDSAKLRHGLAHSHLW
jgi:hypothetical protein